MIPSSSGILSMKAAAERAKRTSQLTMTPENYTGQYSNDFFGTIEVLNTDNTLALKMGDINVVSTPSLKRRAYVLK